MDILQQERSLNELLTCEDLVITNHVKVTRVSDNRVRLDIEFGGNVVGVLVTFSQPFDLQIITPDLFPPHLFDEVSLSDDTSLVGQTKWMMELVRNHHVKSLANRKDTEYISVVCSRLQTMGLEGTQFECVKNGSKVILLIKQKLKLQIPLSNFKALIDQDKLINPGGHFYVLKMIFTSEGSFVPEEFSILYSPDLSLMCPDLHNVSIEEPTDNLDTAKLLEFIFSTTDSLASSVKNAVEGWKARASFLLHLFCVFENHDLIVPHIDIDTMMSMELSFCSSSCRYCCKVILDTDYPGSLPSLSLSVKSEASKLRSKNKKYDISGEDFGLSEGMVPEDVAVVIVRKIGDILDKE